MPKKHQKHAKPLRKQGTSVHRPFGKLTLLTYLQTSYTKLLLVFGSKATPLPADPALRPPGTAPDHTHKWTVYVRGVDGADITYWLKKVQFKLHETYSQSLRTIEAPAPFDVTETGWGEFEVAMKLFFTPEANEKPQSIYHQLKLHPFGEDKEAAKERGDSVVSQNYDEIVFNEPVEAFFDVLTSGPPPAKGKAASKSTKLKKGGDRTAEVPAEDSATNPYSVRTELKELDRLNEAIKQVEALAKEERARLAEREKELESLKKEAGVNKAK